MNTKKKTEKHPPRWVLSDDFAVNVDPYNWVLLARTRNKAGVLGGWRPVGYYPTAIQLFEGLARRMATVTAADCRLEDYMDEVCRRATEAAEKFREALKAMGFSGLRPSDVTRISEVDDGEAG